MKVNEGISQKIIIYDNTCPLCCWYTQKFTQLGFLEEDNRISFSEISQQDYGTIDWEKSRHQIPLVDKNGQQTLYGLDSLLFILGQKIPFIKRIFKLNFIYTFFLFLYNIISYNRRVIMPNAQKQKGFDCTPDFHFGYRSLFVFGLILSATSTFVPNLFYFLTTIVLTSFILLILWSLKWKNTTEILGQIALVLFCASLVNIIFSMFLPAYLVIILTIGTVIQQSYFRLKNLNLVS